MNVAVPAFNHRLCGAGCRNKIHRNLVLCMAGVGILLYDPDLDMVLKGIRKRSISSTTGTSSRVKKIKNY